MTAREFELILLKSGNHKPGTKAAYFRKTAKENDISPMIFFDGLEDAYQRFSEYVNYVPKIRLPDFTLIPAEFSFNDDGKIEPAKQSLNLLIAYPGEGIIGHLTHENITELWEALREFEEYVTEKSKPPSPKGNYDILFEAFIDPEKYQRIINILVNKGLCNNGNYHWQDTKGLLIGILKHLHKQGYLHRELSEKELISISKNIFGIIVSPRTCRVKPEGVRLPGIPLASTF